jgi:ubiquinone/menaquinone biosynthesis C-methylase UbiE
MTIEEARELISKATVSGGQYADLGCGSGTFSYALAGLLPAGSSIICIDKDQQQIKPEYNGVNLQFIKANIEQIELPLLDGILMANSLHYIKNQEAFIQRLKGFTASLILVEYDTDTGNRWVPYPVSFRRMQQLFGHVTRLGERSSVYGRANLYACQIWI